MRHRLVLGALVFSATYGCSPDLVPTAPPAPGSLAPSSALSAACPGAVAEVTTYASKAALLAAWTEPTVTIDFRTNDAGGPITNPSTDAFFSALTLRGATFRNVQSYYNLVVYTFPKTVLHVDLPANTYAAGTELSAFYGVGGTFTITLSDGKVFTVPYAGGYYPPPAYFGVTSSGPIAWIEYMYDNDYIVLGNFLIGTRAGLNVLVSSLTSIINSLTLPPIVRARLLSYVQQIPTAIAGLTPAQKLAGIAAAQAFISLVEGLPADTIPAALACQLVLVANQIIGALSA